MTERVPSSNFFDCERTLPNVSRILPEYFRQRRREIKSSTVEEKVRLMAKSHQNDCNSAAPPRRMPTAKPADQGVPKNASESDVNVVIRTA